MGGREIASCGDAGCGWQPVVTTTFSSTAAQEIDILFVVDNTPAVAGVAANLLGQYPVFAQVLQSLPEGTPPMHVAFVPATLPSRDCTPPGNRAAACGLTAPDQFLTAGYCEVDQNSAGFLGDAFACLGDFGAQGCGIAQPLEAARRALGGDPTGGALTGSSSFLTPGAELLIVFLAGQDDASTLDGVAVPVSDYVNFFGTLTVDSSNLNFISLIGPEGCPDGGPVAPVATPRLDEVLNAVSYRGVAVSICDANLAQALASVAAKIADLISPPCLFGIKDTDLARPGLQADCTIEDRVVEADGSRTVATLPLCDPETPVPPCLSFEAPDDPFNWCAPNGQALMVLRGPDPVAICGPLSTQDRVTCLGCADPSDPACAGPSAAP
jgi:hypothetical protein